MSAMVREEYPVAGMVGHEDEERIRRAVEAVDGVVACVADHAASRVRVSYDPDRADRRRIVEAARAAGFDVGEDGARPLEAPARRIGRPARLSLVGAAVLLLGLLFALRATGVLSRVAPAAASDAYPGFRVASVANGGQVVQTTLFASRYEPIVVQAGLPVRWTIRATADAITSCNGVLTVPSYGIEKRLQPGDNVIEFVPRAAGDVVYTCWMGMISSVIRVVPDLPRPAAAAR
jgi:copper chaperone CopZ